MGKKQGLELVIDAAKILSRRTDLFFLLCGDGVARTDLQRMSAGYRNVRFVPLQPLDRLNELLNMADIHLLPQRAGVDDLVLPSKLINMLASGRPIVATAGVGTLIKNIVDMAGYVVEPGDLEGFVRGIEKLADNPGSRRHFGLQGRDYAVKNFSKESILSKAFSKYLKNIHLQR